MCDTCRVCNSTTEQRQIGTCNGVIDTVCEDKDACLAAPCKNGGTCVNMVIDYSCNCSQGWCGDSCDIAFVDGTCPTVSVASKSNDGISVGVGVSGGLVVLILLIFAFLLFRRRRGDPWSNIDIQATAATIRTKRRKQLQHALKPEQFELITAERQWEISRTRILCKILILRAF